MAELIKKETEGKAAVEAAFSDSKSWTSKIFDRPENQDGLIVRLKKPFEFGGKTYEEIDLTGLENLTVDDMMQINDQWRVVDPDAVQYVMPELAPDYPSVVAYWVTGLPLDFFDALPGREGNKVTNAVTSFLMRGDSPMTDDHIITFAEPYTYEGKQYAKVDLSLLEDVAKGDLKRMQKMWKAESPRAAKCLVPSSDPLYPFIIARQLTKLPLGFFEKLPIVEGRKISMHITAFFGG